MARTAKNDILAAADQLRRDRGFGAVTTKEIARAAEVSEASIYYHFGDKLDLMHAVLEAHLPALLEVTRALPGRAGTSTVTANLATAASSLISFYRAIQPVIAAVQTDAELSRRFRDRLAAQGRGPQRGTEVIAEYLTAEQALGRVSPSADPQAAAVLLTGACHQIAIVDQLLGPGHAVSHPDAASLVTTLLAGLIPHPSV